MPRSVQLRAGKMPSMPIRQIIEGGRVPVKVFTDDLEAHARQQLANVSQICLIGMDGKIGRAHV